MKNTEPSTRAVGLYIIHRQSQEACFHLFNQYFQRVVPTSRQSLILAEATYWEQPSGWNTHSPRAPSPPHSS